MPGRAIRESARCFHSVEAIPLRRRATGAGLAAGPGSGESSRGALALVSMTGSATIGHPCSASREGEKPLHRKPVSRDDPLWRAVMTVSTVRVLTFPPSTHRAPPRIEYRRSSCLLFQAAQHPRPTHTHPDEAPLAAPEGG